MIYPPRKAVLSKKADFAIANSQVLLENLNNNADITYLFAMAQATPLILSSIEKNGIKKLEDLKGKKFLKYADFDNEASLLSMIQSVGLKLSDLQMVQAKLDTLEEITNGTADVCIGYSTITPYVLKQMGFNPVTFHPKDYGYDFYGDILFTTNEYIQNNPKTTKAFYEASLKGWEYAFANIDETINLILEKYNTQELTKDVLEFEAKEFKKLAFAPGVPFGDINPIKIEKIVNSFKLLGLTKSNENNFQEFIYKYNKNNLTLNFTKEELDFINDTIIFKVGYEQNNKPIEFVNEQGLSSGISKEILEFISQNTGIRFVYVPLENDDLTNNLESNKIDFFISKQNSVENLFNFEIPINENKTTLVSLDFQTNNEVLDSILEKSIKSLSENQKEAILRKWIPKYIEKPFDWTIVWILSTVFSLIIILLLYKNINQKNSEKQRLETLVNEKTKDLDLLLSNFKIFTANSIHQVRIPLTVINLYSDMIEKGDIKNNIKSSLIIMEHIYDNLSYKVRRDYLEFKTEKVDLSSLLKDRIELFEVVINANDKEIVSSIEEDIIVDINKTEIEYIIDNNLSNAIKYGFPKEKISVILQKNQSGFILFFSNKGKEIVNKDKIFDRYTRETIEKQGQGIGLHMVKEICDKYSIEIKVEYINNENRFSYIWN